MARLPLQWSQPSPGIRDSGVRVPYNVTDLPFWSGKTRMHPSAETGGRGIGDGIASEPRAAQSGNGLACDGWIGVCLMTNSHTTPDEPNYTLAPLHKQITVLLGLCGLAVATIVVCLAASFFYLQDFANRASVLGEKADYLEKQSEEIKQIGVDLRVQLTQLGEKIERAQQDIVKLKSGVGLTGIAPAITGAEVTRADPNPNRAEVLQAQPNQGGGEENRDESASPGGGSTAISSLAAPPLPRPRSPAARPAPIAGGPTAAVELKVGSVISPTQFALQPIPEELAEAMPRLKGKQFFRYSEQIFVVDPKDNRIVELLR